MPRILRVHSKPVWPFGINRNSPQANGLIGWWPLHEGGGGRVRDMCNGPPGVLTNFAYTAASGWAGGRKGGKSLRWDSGGDDYVSVVYGPQLKRPTTQMAFSAWAFSETTAQTALACVWTYTGQGCWLLRLNEGGATNAVIYICDSLGDVGNNKATSNARSNSVWEHYAMVYDGTLTGNANRLKWFVNGVQRTLDFLGTIPASLTTTASTPFEIGSFNNHTTERFSGYIDDVRYYEKALSAETIFQMYSPETAFDLYLPLQRKRTYVPVGGTPVSNDFVGAHEALVTPAPTFAGTHESLLSLLQTMQGNLEALEAASQTAQGAHEAQGYLEKSAVGAHEGLEAPSQTMQGALEALLPLSQTMRGALEALEAPSQGFVGAHEATSSETAVSADFSGCLEAQGYVEANRAGTHEGVFTVTQTVQGAHEALLSVVTELAGAHEGLAGPASALAGAHEALGYLTSNLTGEHEALQSIAPAYSGAHESIGELIQVSADFTGAHEALGYLEAARTGAHENTGNPLAIIETLLDAEQVIKILYDPVYRAIRIKTLGPSSGLLQVMDWQQAITRAYDPVDGKIRVVT